MPQMPTAGPPESIDLYPNEMNSVRELAADLQNKYGFKPFTDTTSKAFEAEVPDRFAALGLLAKVYWKDVDVDGDPNSDTLYFLPTIAIEARIDPKDYTIDHEQMSREIQSGAADGKEGTLRADGTLGDPKSKLILP